MDTLIAIQYPSEECAREMMASLRDLHDARVVHVVDACYVNKDELGRIQLRQTVNTTARGALGGAALGSIVGAFVLNPVIGLLAGLATGLAAGAIAGRLTDIGIDDVFMRELTRKMEPRRCAVFVLLRRPPSDRVRAELRRHGGNVMYTSLSAHAEQRLHDVLDGSVMRRYSAIGAVSRDERRAS